jgi:branched-chain amino acid transport system ATP-binding protein
MGAFLNDDRHEVEQRMERVLGTFPDLSERTSQRAATLSGGQQQMLALGRSLMMDPKLIMIDEPSLGLAPKIVDQIFETIHGFTKMGITVLLVEQNARKGLESTDWAFVLDLGSKRFEGPSEGILADPRIEHLYLGKQLTDPEGGSPT